MKQAQEEYKGHECKSCGYRKVIDYNEDFPLGQLLLWTLSAKAFFPIERAVRIKLPRWGCPKCDGEDTFYSSWLEREVAKIDEGILKKKGSNEGEIAKIKEQPTDKSKFGYVG